MRSLNVFPILFLACYFSFESNSQIVPSDRFYDRHSARVDFSEKANNGLYLLRIIYGEKTFHYKFIKRD